MAEIERIGPDSPIIQIKTPDHSPASSISSQKFTSYSDGKCLKLVKHAVCLGCILSSKSS